MLNLFDAVLQHDDDGVLAAQPGQPTRCLGVLGRLDRQQHNPHRAADLGGIGAHRARHGDAIGAVGPKLDVRSRGPPADPHRVPSGGEVCRDRRADGTRTDNCNIHDNHRNYRL
jgi:hypothetical protein